MAHRRVPAREAGQGRRVRPDEAEGLRLGRRRRPHLPRRREVRRGSAPRPRTCSTSTTPGDEVVFMDEETFEQLSLPRSAVEDALPFMQPSSSVQVLFVGGTPLGDRPAGRGRARGDRHRAGRQGRHGLERDEAGDARDGRGRPGAALRRSRRQDQGRPARAALHQPRPGRGRAAIVDGIRAVRGGAPLSAQVVADAELVDTSIRVLSQEPLAGRCRPPSFASRRSSTGRATPTWRSRAAAPSTRRCRRGVESPWERIRAIRARTQTPLMLALRGRFLVGSRPVERRLRPPLHRERRRERHRRLPAPRPAQRRRATSGRGRRR